MQKPVVLLVLSQSDDLDKYGSFLREQGYATVACSSPGEGMNFLEAQTPALVIVGQDTPEFEGRLLLQHSLRRHPGVPVLVIARSMEIHCYLDAITTGAMDYLEKPAPKDLAWLVDTKILRNAAA